MFLNMFYTIIFLNQQSYFYKGVLLHNVGNIQYGNSQLPGSSSPNFKN